MSTLRIKVLENEREKADAVQMETIFATQGLTDVIEVERVRDMNIIKKFNVSSTPALVVNDKIKVFDGVPKREEIKKWIHEEFKSAS